MYIHITMGLHTFLIIFKQSEFLYCDLKNWPRNVHHNDGILFFLVKLVDRSIDINKN